MSKGSRLGRGKKCIVQFTTRFIAENFSNYKTCKEFPLVFSKKFVLFFCKDFFGIFEGGTFWEGEKMYSSKKKASINQLFFYVNFVTKRRCGKFLLLFFFWVNF